MTAPTKPSEALRADQRQILAYLKTQPDGATAAWVADACGHANDTAWAANRLKTLAKRGLFRDMARGWFSLNETGLAALAESSGQ